MLPEIIPNWIDGQEHAARASEYFEKLNPATGETLCRVARSRTEDVQLAVTSAQRAQPSWAQVPPVKRGHILHAIAMRLRDCREEVAQIVALETGKSYPSALGETDGAIELGLFMAGEVSVCTDAPRPVARPINTQ
jgi:acyl-CoA reductase-like NAD-dependent aldehyde dehydrogenase